MTLETIVVLSWIGLSLLHVILRFCIHCYLGEQDEQKDKSTNNNRYSEDYRALYTIATNNLSDLKDRQINFTYYTVLVYGIIYEVFHIINGDLSSKVLLSLLAFLISSMGICLVFNIQEAIRGERGGIVLLGDLFERSIPHIRDKEKEKRKYARFCRDIDVLFIYLTTNILGLGIVTWIILSK